MVMLNARENAERIVKARENLYSTMPKKTAEIKFFQKDFPVSVEGWMAILPELRKQVTPQKLERQLWGANVEFMLATDMAIKRDV